MLLENQNALSATAATIGNEVSLVGKAHARLGVPFKHEVLGTLAYIEALDPVRMNALTQRIARYRKILSSIEESEISIRDNFRVTQLALKILNMQCDPRFLESLNETDLIEIYDLDMTQVFRNFRFFEICGYSLLEVESYPWHELYERSHLITEKLIKSASDVVMNAIGCHKILMPPHYMKEKFSSTRQVVEVTLKNASCVLDSFGKPAGFIVSQDVRIVLPTDYNNRIDFI